MAHNLLTAEAEATVKQAQHTINTMGRFPDGWSAYWNLRLDGMVIAKALMVMYRTGLEDWDSITPTKARGYECVYMDIMREREAKREEVLRSDGIEYTAKPVPMPANNFWLGK
jgi:hypothetical protein